MVLSLHDYLPEGMFKEVMNDLWLARIKPYHVMRNPYHVLIKPHHAMINHMWILKNSKDLLDNLKSRSFSQVSSIKTFDFSTLPHDKLKTRLKETIHKAFSHRNYGSKFVVLGDLCHYASKQFHNISVSLFYCRQNLCQVNRQFFRRTS
jgi:hypothetical protein